MRSTTTLSIIAIATIIACGPLPDETEGSGGASQSGSGPSGSGSGMMSGTGSGSGSGGGSGGSTGNSNQGLSCAQLQDCYGACNDDACVQNCYGQGSPEGKAADDALYNCIVMNQCQDTACAQQHCTPQIDACFGGSSGQGSGGSGGGPGPACGNPVPDQVVNTLNACIELKAAVSGNCALANGIWDPIECCAHMGSCSLEIGVENTCIQCIVAQSTSPAGCHQNGFDISPCF